MFLLHRPHQSLKPLYFCHYYYDVNPLFLLIPDSFSPLKDSAMLLVISCSSGSRHCVAVSHHVNMHAPHCDYFTTQFAAISSLQTRLTKLEDSVRKLTGAPSSVSEAPPPVSNDDDDDFDLFGSDDEGSKVEKPVETKKKSKSEFIILIEKSIN